MYNKVILMGRICHDLELKTTTSGISVLSFRIAVDRSYAAKGEERQTDFFNIVAWRSTAEFINRYFGKGRMILLEGELQTRQYTDKNNQTQQVTEIVASNANFTGEPKQTGNAMGSYQAPPQPAPQYQAPVQQPAPAMAQGSAEDFVAMTDTDDDYPF